MGRHRSGAVLFGAALFLAGCAFSPGDVWPTLSGDEGSSESPPPQQVTAGPSAAGQQSPPAVTPASEVAPTAATAAPVAEQAQPFGATGTFVGAKIAQHARDLEMLAAGIGAANTRFRQLRAITEQNAQRYYAIVAAISARLQVGTTPGNPVLVSQWNTAQSELDRILADAAALNTLANDIASQAATSTYLIESIAAAYGLPGAVEEDHERLAQVEEAVKRTAVLIDRLLDEINDAIARETAYVNDERRNLTTLSLAIKSGQLFGPPPVNRGVAAATPAAAQQTRRSAKATAGATAVDARQPLVVIRFDRPDVPYQQALYTAVSQALERRPASAFDVVAVAAGEGSAAEVAFNRGESKRNGERVLRTLAEMGLPGDRMTLSATASGAVRTNEVHIYVR